MSTTPREKSARVTQSATPITQGKSSEVLLRELTKAIADQQTHLKSVQQELTEIRQILTNQNKAMSANSVNAKDSLVSKDSN
jgi:septal ring factor EnvC (AmiA/AmiB activator)